MARTAKRRQHAKVQNDTCVQPTKIYQTAIYARLSREDNLCGSDSIEHQVALLKSYIDDRPFLHLVEVFSDNGFTGTDFERPEWQRLIAAVQKGEINCIIVKDLSRLGRNYIESGEFLEKICPFFGIRFISVNDDFDTETAEENGQLSASLSNIINDYYAKDISRKVTTALRSKMERGEYIGKWAKYGYSKSPNDKNKLIINPETAPIVHLIYEWRSQGMSYMGINKKLNDMGIPSPSQLKADQGIVTNNNQKKRQILWNKHIVTIILNDITYIGHLAQRKDTQCLYAGIPITHVGQEDWIVVKNTHEPIIEQELFDKVQEINQNAARAQKSNYGKYSYLPKADNIYGKKFTCSDCGSSMKLVRSISTKKDKAYFTFKCPKHEEHGARACNVKRIRKADLDEAVLATIKTQFDLFLDLHQTLDSLRAMKKTKVNQSAHAEEIKVIKLKIEQKKSVFADLYRDLHEGLLDEEDYIQTREIITKDIDHLEQQLAEIESTNEQAQKQLDGVNNLNAIVNQYYDAKEITAELVEAMIDTMQMHEDNSLSIQLKYMDTFKEMMRTIETLRGEVA